MIVIIVIVVIMADAAWVLGSILTVLRIIVGGTIITIKDC